MTRSARAEGKKRKWNKTKKKKGMTEESIHCRGDQDVQPPASPFIFTPRPILHPEITSCFYPNFISELPGMVPNNPANRGNNIIISHTIQGNPSGEPAGRMSSCLIETVGRARVWACVCVRAREYEKKRKKKGKVGMDVQ